MGWRNVWTVAGCAAALILAGGTPVAATRPSSLREVQLGGSGAGWDVRYVFDMNRRGQILGGLVDENGATRIGIWRRYVHPVVIDVPDEVPRQLTDKGDVLGTTWYWRGGRTYSVTHPSRNLSLSGRNNRGEMAGTLDRTAVEPPTAFLWRNGTFIDLGAAEGRGTRATTLNNHGDVLGVVIDADGLPGPSRQAFVWRDGAMNLIDIPAAGDPEAPGVYPRDINDRGQAIFNTGSGRPYLWDRGRLIDLLAGQPDKLGMVWDINNAGDIVGSVDGQALWRNGRTIPLRLPAEQGWSGQAFAINDHGDVAGRLSHDRADSRTEVRAALWRDGRLLTSPGASGEEISLSVVGVDDRGRIAGSVSDGATGERQLVWIPTRR